MFSSTEILVLSSLDGEALRLLLAALVDELPGCGVDLVLLTRRQSLKNICNRQLRNLRYHGPLWIPFRLAVVLIELLRLFSGGRKRTALPPLPPSVRVRKVGSFASSEFIEEVRTRGYALGVVFGAPILRRQLFSSPRLGMINIHQGLIPRFRGMPPAFWELYSGAEETGVSIHRVSEVLDGGDLLHQEGIPIMAGDTVEELQRQLDSLAVRIAPAVVRSVLQGAAAALPVDVSAGKVYRRPTAAQVIRLALRGKCRIA